MILRKKEDSIMSSQPWKFLWADWLLMMVSRCISRNACFFSYSFDSYWSLAKKLIETQRLVQVPNSLLHYHSQLALCTVLEPDTTLYFSDLFSLLLLIPVHNDAHTKNSIISVIVCVCNAWLHLCFNVLLFYNFQLLI